jgi:hypothetical protein
MATTGESAGRRGLQSPVLAGTMAVGALAVGALALAACGSVVAPAAHNVGASSSAAASGAAQSGAAPSGAASAVSASQLLCARPAVTSRVVIAQSLLPRPILPVRPGQQGTAPKPGIQPRPPAPPKPGSPATPPPPPPPPGAPGQPPKAGAPRPGLFVVKTVTNPSKVHALAQAVCGLPKFPREPINCPALFAGSYLLTFTSAAQKLPTVVVQDSGCQTVTGAGVVRKASGQPAFWKLLTRLAGPAVHPPGHLPGGPGGPLIPGQQCRRPAAGKVARACPG